MRKIDARLEEQLRMVVHSMGYELLGVEQIRSGRTTTLRLYIDHVKGVSIDDCSKVSHQVSDMLDVSNPIEGSYNLEVSSPGIDRPLFELAHFKKFIGKKVKVKLRSTVNERRKYKGVIQRVEGDNIHLWVDGKDEVIVAFSDIEKANLIGDLYL